MSHTFFLNLNSMKHFKSKKAFNSKFDIFIEKSYLLICVQLFLGADMKFYVNTN